MTTGLPPYVILGGIKSFSKSASLPENKQKNRKEKEGIIEVVHKCPII
jgi:hypothetical protein